MSPRTPRLRIIQVNSLFSGGGADNRTLQLAVGLCGLSDKVTLAIPHGSRWEALARRSGGVRVETFTPRSLLKLAVIRTLIRVIRKDRIQILHAHQGRDYWPAIAAARFAGCGTRVVVTRHLMSRPRGLSRMMLLRMSDVVAVSQAVEGVLERELRGPREYLHQIYCGIDVTAFLPGRPPAARTLRQQQGWRTDDVVFGVVGAFNLPRGKGQLEFLEAAARLKSQSPKARFVIVGSGSMESLLRERIETLGLGGIAVILPFADDVATVMSALDVLVHPALGTEALGVVLLEAMACGKPVIASRLDGIPETLTEGVHGLLVPPADTLALAETMGRVVADAGLRATLGSAGRSHIEANFSRHILATKTHELYANILQRR